MECLPYAGASFFGPTRLMDHSSTVPYTSVGAFLLRITVSTNSSHPSNEVLHIEQHADSCFRFFYCFASSWRPRLVQIMLPYSPKPRPTLLLGDQYIQRAHLFPWIHLVCAHADIILALVIPKKHAD